MNKLGKPLGGKQYSGNAAMDWVNLIAAMFGNHFLFWAHGIEPQLGTGKWKCWQRADGIKMPPSWISLEKDRKAEVDECSHRDPIQVR